MSMLKNYRLTLYAWSGYVAGILSDTNGIRMLGLIVFVGCIFMILTYRCKPCGKFWWADLKMPRDIWKFTVFVHGCRSQPSEGIKYE